MSCNLGQHSLPQAALPQSALSSPAPQFHMSKSFLCVHFQCHPVRDAVYPAPLCAVLVPQKVRTHIMESPFGRVPFQSPMVLTVQNSSQGFPKHSKENGICLASSRPCLDLPQIPLSCLIVSHCCALYQLQGPPCYSSACSSLWIFPQAVPSVCGTILCSAPSHPFGSAKCHLL